jgi:hydrogenase maturation protease
MSILVLGLGQSLRGDDSAGLEAVRLWQAQYPQTAHKVQAELSELPGLSLLDRLEGIQAAILVDAVHAAAAPGTLYHFSPYELSAFTTDSQSAHGWGVAETLKLGLSLYPELKDCHINLIGIVGMQFDLGASLSPHIQAALPDAAALIEKEVQSLLD